jgi:hypothetical protein
MWLVRKTVRELDCFCQEAVIPCVIPAKAGIQCFQSGATGDCTPLSHEYNRRGTGKMPVLLPFLYLVVARCAMAVRGVTIAPVV